VIATGRNDRAEIRQCRRLIVSGSTTIRALRSEPGAMKALQQSNPAHFDEIRRILDGLRRRPDAEVPHWMEVSVGARDISYVPVILTSHPPKRRLSRNTVSRCVVVLPQSR
jgi:hypothetical protein